MNSGKATSTPTLTKFNPRLIPYQYQVLKLIRTELDYSLGAHEILLSGSVGSAKSILMAHIALTHCLLNPGARFLLGRRSMPDLRSTIFLKILEHIGADLIEEEDEFVENKTIASIKLPMNGSEIISRSWADKHYHKMRSLELSGAAIEETTENRDSEFYEEIKMRVGRLPHVKENIIINATNPAGPDHWLYNHFNIGDPENRINTRHVFYSVTTDNPFLPPQYIEQLKRDLDPKLAQRMIYGQWVEIKGEVVYYAYEKAVNFRDVDYVVDPKHPIIITFDFNIGEGKPMSVALGQYIDGIFHWFDEVIINGARTAETIEEIDGRGYFRKDWKYIIAGDASGKHKDTRSHRSDYDIILKGFQDRQLQHEYLVPLANPPVRTRHNKVNAQFKNTLGQIRCFTYKKCKKLDQGFRLVKLKPGADYIEDDSKDYQHVTTAVGYAIIALINRADSKPQGSQRL